VKVPVVLASALAVALLVSGYVLALFAATGLSGPSPLEASLERDGVKVDRSASGPLYPISEGRPASMILVNPPPLLGAERKALETYVADGGFVLIASLHPENALWSGLAGSVRVLPGDIYGPDGKMPTQQVLGSNQMFERSGMRGIVAKDGVGAAAIVRSEAVDARDTTGDGVLTAGEPTGPFDVAVQRKQDAALDESRQNGRAEVSPNFVLAQPSRFTTGVESFRAEGAQIVVPVVRGNVPYPCRAVRISRPDDCVQCQSIEAIRLGRAVEKRAYALGKIDVPAHLRGPGGGLTGVATFALGEVVVAGGVVRGVAGFADTG